MSTAEPLTAESRISYTLFHDVFATSKTDRLDVPWSELVEKIRNAPTYINKHDCPLISLGQYGSQFSKDREGRDVSLRHAANLVCVYGAELDYDGEIVQPSEAAQLLQASNIEALIYTSPSHTPERPRFRILFRFSAGSPPEVRKVCVARANRVLGGIAANESFTLSQSYYVGRLRGAEYIVLETTGRTLDLATDIEPLYYVGGANDGATHVDATTDEKLRESFARGEDRYQAMLKLSSRWAARGMAVDDIKAALGELLGTDTTNADGIDLRTRIPGIAAGAVRKYGETRVPKLTTIAAKESEQKPRIQLMTQPEDWFTSRAPALEFLVEGLLPRGAVAMNIAEPATGKTSLMTKLGFHVAMGLDFLERATLQGTVAYVALEDRLPMLRRRFEFTRDRIIKALQDAQTSPEEIDRRIDMLKKNFHFMAGAGTEVHLASLVMGVVTQMPDTGALIAALPRPLELLILDPYARLHGCDENSTPLGTAMVTAFERIAREVGCAVMISHHVSKSTAADRQDDLFSGRGSTAVPAAARVLWRMMIAGENETYGFKNLEPGVAARGDLVKLTVPKANDFKRPEGTIWLRRQALDFEVFNPEIGGGEVALQKQLCELYAWWVQGGRPPFYKSHVVEKRTLIFPRPGRKPLTKSEAELVVIHGEDKGLLVMGEEKPPRCDKPGLKFKDGYDPTAM